MLSMPCSNRREGKAVMFLVWTLGNPAQPRMRGFSIQRSGFGRTRRLVLLRDPLARTCLQTSWSKKASQADLDADFRTNVRHPVARRNSTLPARRDRQLLPTHPRVELAARLEPQSTCAILSTAGAGLDLSRNPATVVADSGVENVNGDVDALLGLGRLRHVLAQVEVTFSNSMVEAWWRSLKHNWLFLNHLDTLATVERLIAFYVQQHNAVIPHSAFHGQTPDEMYFGTGTTIPEHLTVARRLARDARLDKNRSLHCRACPPDFFPPISPPDPASPVISSLLQLHAPNSRMS